MADGIVDSIAGGLSEEAADIGDATPQTGLDPSAAAAAMDAAKSDPELADEARLYFREQRRLVEIQQARLLLRRTSDRLRIGLQIFISLVGSGLAATFLWLVYSAAHSYSVVIDPISVPPSLAQRGLTGKVLGQALLDELTRLKEKTGVPSIERDLTNAWTNQITLQLPNSGLSLGEIEGVLKDLIGHDVHIDGDLVEDQNGAITLTVRGAGIPAQSFTARSQDLNPLVAQAADYIYQTGQPANYAWYLLKSGREAETLEFAGAAYGRTPLGDRPILLVAQGLALPGKRSAESLEIYRRALALNPSYWAAYNTIQFSLISIGEQAKVCQTADDMKRVAGGRPGRANELWYLHCDTLTRNLLAMKAAIAAEIDKYGSHGPMYVASLTPYLLETDILLHDFADAAALKHSAAYEKGIEQSPRYHIAEALLAVQGHDLPQAESEITAAITLSDDDFIRMHAHCEAALIEEALGKPDKADAALTAGGRHVDCLRYKADILGRRGDWPAAQAAYAAAVEFAPDYPLAFYSWGVALAQHGDDAGAIEKLKAAAQRGPHWADPIKAWGDVLAHQGRRKDALARYNQALHYAPAWKELIQIRDQTAASK